MVVKNPVRRIVLLAVALAAVGVALAPGQQPQILLVAQPAAEAVTYQDVLKLLRTGKSEQEILDHLSKTTIKVEFILGDKQVEELQKMRVSTEFIDALKKRQAGSVTNLGDVTNVAIILDCSGSMIEKTKEGVTKMEAARKTVIDLLRKVPVGLRLTFIVYGHNVEQQCQAVKVVRPLIELDESGRTELIRFVSLQQPTGHTPIALALRTAGKELAKIRGLSEVFLITDGMESCKGDPAQEAADLAKNLNLKSGVNVIGFDVKPEERAAVEKIAKAGRGKFYDARSATELIQAVAEVERKIVQVAPPAPVIVDAAPAEDIKAAFTFYIEDQLNSTTPSLRYPVALVKEHTYVINLLAANNEKLDPYLALLDPGGKELKRDDDAGEGNNAHITFQAPSDGKYQIVAKSSGSQKNTGPFTLTVMEQAKANAMTFLGPAVGKPREVGSGLEIKGKLDRANKSIRYAVMLRDGKNYALNMISANEKTLDPYMVVLDAGGRELARDDDSGEGSNAHITFRAPATLPYVIVATSFGTKNTGNFTFTVQERE